MKNSTISSQSNLDFQHLQNYVARVETALEHWLIKENQSPTKLHQAMRYAVLGGGKRIRALLVYTVANMLQIDLAFADRMACAIELIHAYSLVHDDLPAMDDDDLRRNKPTVHIAYDEAIAILVGDALQTLAFYILSNEPSMPGCVHLLAEASGSLGMVGGQAMDMEAEHQQLTVTQLEQMFYLKTGQLIRAAILMPCYAPALKLNTEVVDSLDQFAKCIGLAFQIRDDILDVEGSTEIIGKPQGSDIEQGKATYPALFGLEKAKQRAEELYIQAMNHLEIFGESAESLKQLSQYIIARNF